MAKKKQNVRCPFKYECEKKCEYELHEKDCDYYSANETPENFIEDQGGNILPNDEMHEEPEFVYTENVTGQIVNIPIGLLHNHHQNPRKDFGDLSELTESIRVKGVLQNLTVVPFWFETTGVGCDRADQQADMGYLVVIGNRRLKAARMAGLETLPCIISDMSHQDQVSTMLVENMQRNDLTVYEQAQGFQMMLDFGDTVDTIAEKSGFSKTTVRRRVKLLELDAEKFKQSISRGATLFDYMELDKIKDTDLKNEVLDTVGTENFNYSLKRALEKEETQAYLDTVEDNLSQFATKIENTDGYRYKVGYGTYNKTKDFTPPEDAETTEYFYYREKSYVSLYVKEDEVSNQCDEQARAEKEEKRNQKLSELEEISDRAYELRKEFVDSLTATVIKKRLPEIIAFWMYQLSKDNKWFDGEDALDIAGIEIDEDYEGDSLQYTYEDILKSVQQSPEVKLWEMIWSQLDDNENNTYYKNYYGEHKENEELTDIYEFLERLGYGMSDEEKAMRDGTHALFIAESEESK